MSATKQPRVIRVEGGATLATACYFVNNDRGAVSHLIFHAVEGDMKAVRQAADKK